MKKPKPKYDDALKPGEDYVQKAAEGSKITMLLWVAGEQERKELVVKAACADKNNGQWYCSTHEQAFDNQFSKDMHIGDHNKKHVMVWVCRAHGVEVP